jgi:hypothetical protein
MQVINLRPLREIALLNSTESKAQNQCRFEKKKKNTKGTEFA